MERRDFIKWTGWGLFSLYLTGCSKSQDQVATDIPAVEQPVKAVMPSAYDNKKLIVAEGTDPAAMMSQGLAALGGLEQMVKPGSVVVIKPNFSVPQAPEVAATTKPVLVAALVKKCLAAGASQSDRPSLYQWCVMPAEDRHQERSRSRRGQDICAGQSQ